MTLKRLRRNWDHLGKTDSLWAILSVPEMRGNRWDLDAFQCTGKQEIANLMADLNGLGLEPTLGRALDFGCGVGGLTQALAERFEEAWGVDIAPSMIELANRCNRHPDNSRYFLNDRPDLRLVEDETFDLIYSNITLQHVEPIYHGTYLADFLRILVPGGLLVFQLPSTKRALDGPISSARGGDCPAEDLDAGPTSRHLPAHLGPHRGPRSAGLGNAQRRGRGASCATRRRGRERRAGRVGSRLVRIPLHRGQGSLTR